MLIMAEKKEKEKQIHWKNYVILALIFLGGILLTVYFCKWYHVYDEYQKQTPVIRGTLSEIMPEDLEHYVMENPTTVIYMCTSSDMVCRNYEKDFKKLVEQETLQDQIIYLNLSNADITSFIEKFNQSYPYKVKLTEKYPAIIMFEDGEVKNILQGTEKEKLTITKTKQFIDINKIGEQAY